MICGDKNIYAVEYNIDSILSEWVLGTFFFWIKGKKYGDPNDSVDLNGSRNWAIYFVNSSQNLINQQYFDMPIDQIDKRIGDISNIKTEDFKYHIDYIGMSSFDHDCNIFITIKSMSGIERLLWKSKLEKIQDIFLREEYIEEVLKEFIKQYDISMQKS